MKKTIYKFSTSTCGPCRMVKKFWDKLIEDPELSEVTFIEYVVDKDDTAMAMAKQYNITQLPGFVILGEDNTVLKQFNGFISQAQLKKNILENG